MKLATWNVNSIRARNDRLFAWLAQAAPDVVCLQETKVEDSGFPFDALAAAGYHAVTLGQRSYNGVAILSREPATEVVRGFDDDQPADDQARVIAATVRGVRVVCVYCPNGQALGTDKFAYKLAWFERLRRYLDRRDPQEALALLGDMNVAPEDRDVHDPAAWRGKIHCSEPERQALAHVVAWGMRDVFRDHHSEAGFYSWWDYRGVSLFKNLGLRIDHIFATPSLADRVTGCTIDREARKGANASDHAPVIAEIREP